MARMILKKVLIVAAILLIIVGGWKFYYRERPFSDVDIDWDVAELSLVGYGEAGKVAVYDIFEISEDELREILEPIMVVPRMVDWPGQRLHAMPGKYIDFVFVTTEEPYQTIQLAIGYKGQIMINYVGGKRTDWVDKEMIAWTKLIECVPEEVFE